MTPDGLAVIPGPSPTLPFQGSRAVLRGIHSPLRDLPDFLFSFAITMMMMMSRRLCPALVSSVLVLLPRLCERLALRDRLH